MITNTYNEAARIIGFKNAHHFFNSCGDDMKRVNRFLKAVADRDGLKQSLIVNDTYFQNSPDRYERKTNTIKLFRKKRKGP